MDFKRLLKEKKQKLIKILLKQILFVMSYLKRVLN